MNNREHTGGIEFGRDVLPLEGVFVDLIMTPIVAGKPVTKARHEERRRVEAVTCYSGIIKICLSTPDGNPRILVLENQEWSLQQGMGDPSLQNIGWQPEITAFKNVG